MKMHKKSKIKIYESKFVSFFYFMFQNETIFILTCKIITIIDTLFKKNFKIKTINGQERSFKGM